MNVDLNAGAYGEIYLKFLRQVIRERITAALMPAAELVVKRAVDEAMEHLETVIRAEIQPHTMQQFIDIVVRKKNLVGEDQ